MCAYQKLEVKEQGPALIHTHRAQTENDDGASKEKQGHLIQRKQNIRHTTILLLDPHHRRRDKRSEIENLLNPTH